MAGFIDRGPKRNTYFLSINGNGDLYERSSEPKEGFEPHVDDKGTITGYWRTHPGGLSAYLNGIGISTYTNKQNIPMSNFYMLFRDYTSDDDFFISFPLKNTKGGIYRYVKSFVQYYENIDLTREITINSFKRGKDDKYPPSNLFFGYTAKEGGKAEPIPMFFKKGQNGWVEAKEVVSYDGTKSYDLRDQDAFVYSKLKSYIEGFKEKVAKAREVINAKMRAEGLNAPAPLPDPKKDPEGFYDATQQQQPQQPQPQNVEHITQQQAAPASPAQSGSIGAQPQIPHYEDDLPF